MVARDGGAMVAILDLLVEERTISKDMLVILLSQVGFECGTGVGV